MSETVSTVDEKAESTSANEIVRKSGVISVLKIQHKVLPSGEKLLDFFMIN